ncbi:hypothetical protein DJ69_16945 [Halorubrum persicum]|uniref:histidine kinase n=1 Tax=Halorubrum persicum TaxID=1383844 RepID=A0A2G1WEH0_9EURY|nr:PAS domain S-box protein [Halorubrum persicum]PHQ37387.1 hypothetical protein DJ69_16945 [Halorubrum persicum]
MSFVSADPKEVLERIEDAFFAIDEEWRFTYLNARAAEMLEVDRDAVVGAVLWDEFSEATGTSFQREYEHAMNEQESVSFEEYYPPLDTWFEVSAYPSETGLSVYFRDVTDRVERERELERYEGIVETAQEGIYVVDEDGVFQMVNRSYTEMVGYSEAELLGNDVTMVADEEAAETAAAFEAELREGARSSASLEATLERADGETFSAVATFSLLPSGDRVGVVRDVTEQRERERELARTRELLEQAERIADVAGWEIDAETLEMFWSNHLFDLLGVDVEEEPSLDDSFDLCHEDDRPLAEDAVTEAIESAEPFDIEARFVVGDGETRWLHVQGVPVTADGEVTKLRGAAQDITERKERVRDLELYERVVETTNDGVYAVDQNNRFIMVNDAFCELTGYDRTDLLGQPVTVLKDETVSSKAERLAEEIINEGRDEAKVELTLHTKAGADLPVEARLEPLEFQEGIGRCGVVRDITQRKLFEERLVSLHGVTSELFRADSEETVAETAMRAVRNVLDAPAAWYFDYDAAEGVLAPRTASDSADILDFELPELTLQSETVVGSAFVEDESRRIDDIRNTPEYDDFDRDADLRSAVLSPVGNRGVLVAGSPAVGAFDERTRQLLEIVSTAVAAAFNRVEREQMLRDQHERLSAFNDLNLLVHSLAESMFGLSSHSDIEELVCERLASSGSYEFAWIGTAEDDEVRVSAEAGVEGYLDDTTIRLDEGPTTEGPTAQAFLTGEVQTVQDVLSEDRYEPWQTHAREFGYRSSAAVPIVNDSLYGTLNLYSHRANAFDDEEQEALQRLGSIIAYALESVERDRELQQERNRLEFMNRLLRHNLLNSLNVVKARLDLLDGRVDYEVSSDLETATQRTQEMIEFVETVRRVTDVIGRGEDQQLRPCDLGSVLERRVARAQQTYPGATYHLESAPSVDIVADDLLGEVLDNVLINAVQHNADTDPAVWVDATVDDESVVVSVADDGPGIPDERKSTVFDRTTKEFEDPGSGFGLHLVKEIISSYGGDIEVDDNDPEGAVFRLRFDRAESR